PPPLVVSRGTGDGVESDGHSGRIVGIVVVLLLVAVVAVALVTRLPVMDDNGAVDEVTSSPAPVHVPVPRRREPLPEVIEESTDVPQQPDAAAVVADELQQAPAEP